MPRVRRSDFSSTAWIEGKFAKHGVKKIVPDDKILADAYQRKSQYTVVQKAIQKGTGLREKIEEKLEADSTLTWDAAIAEIIGDESTPKEEPKA